MTPMVLSLDLETRQVGDNFEIFVTDRTNVVHNRHFISLKCLSVKLTIFIISVLALVFIFVVVLSNNQ